VLTVKSPFSGRPPGHPSRSPLPGLPSQTARRCDTGSHHHDHTHSDGQTPLRSHFLFESQFTLVGLEGTHEKGGVENEVGRFRRRHFVPVPEVATLAELNDRLRAACVEDLGRRIVGRTETVGEALAREKPLLRALPAEPFAVAEPGEVRVDAKGLVTIRQNRYSVPIGLAGRRVVIQVGARWIVVVADGREVARHERLTGRFAVAARLEHYLPLLERKPGALAGSLPLAQARDRGAWPEDFDRLWTALEQRHGPSEGARQMVDLLHLTGELGAERVALACRGALTAGALDARAVAVLARRAERPAAAPLTGLAPALEAVARPEPALASYDACLTGRPNDEPRRPRPGARRADRSARDRAETADRPPPLPPARRRGAARAADPGRLPRRPP
jgi:hypothetical protein